MTAFKKSAPPFATRLDCGHECPTTRGITLQHSDQAPLAHQAAVHGISMTVSGLALKSRNKWQRPQSGLGENWLAPGGGGGVQDPFPDPPPLLGSRDGDARQADRGGWGGS